MTTNQRLATNHDGPYELLADIRCFLDELLPDEENSVIVCTNTDPHHLPQAIAIGYYILKKIITEMGGLN